MKLMQPGRVAAALALVLAASTGWSATMMGNNSNKGSLLVFPRIDVRPGVDTLITLVNDGSVATLVKCYYRASEPVPTPLPSTFDVRWIKHTMDFTLNLTHNQPLTWSAATGIATDGVTQVAQPFTSWPDGSTRATGELKCFAQSNDPGNFRNGMQVNYNQLFGTATIAGAPFGTGGQAWEYNAWAFQALGGTSAQGQPVGTPGVLKLDGTLNGYDLCPNILLADFQPAGIPPGLAGPLSGSSAATQISIATCSQDMTQAAQPFITKYTYTFWNADEFARTGTHECGDSYYETTLPTTTGGGMAGMPLAQFASLGTAGAYMRIESVADTAICANAVAVGMMGVVAHANGSIYVRGSNMIGRGTRAGFLLYDAGQAGSFKQ